MELKLILAECISQGVSLSLQEEQLGLHFEHSPTAELIALLKENKPVLIEHLKSLQSRGEIFEIKQRDTASCEVPMALAQQRIWSIAKLEDSHNQYNMAQVFRVTGLFDVSRAQRVLTNLIERHQILRTTYDEKGDQPVQIINDEFVFDIAQFDLSHENTEVQESKIKQQLSEFSQASFDLSKDLMVRAAYIRQSETNGVFALVIHHIASDGWSVGLMVKEFLQAYRDGIESLDPVSIQFSDYAQSQRDWIASGNLSKQLAYWQKQLADVPVVHQLPLNFVRPKYQKYHGQQHQQFLNESLTKKLKALAVRYKVTPFMLMHSLFALTVSRFSNEPIVSIGTPVANRQAKGSQDMLGFFANTLVLKTDISGNPSFADFLQQVRNVNLAMQENQDVPFDLLVETLNPSRSASHTPLCQLFISQDSTEKHVTRLDGVRFEPFEIDHQSTKFDIELKLSEKEDELDLTLEYSTSVFTQAAIMRISDAIVTLAEHVCDAPQTPVLSLQIVPSQSRELIESHSHGDTEHFADSHLLIHELFIKQVLDTPDATAVEDEKGAMSYLSLFNAADTLSKQIGELAKDQLVGVLLPKGREQLIACLAVMMSGGAYLPLDLEWPTDRIETVLQQGQANTLIVDRHTGEPFSHYQLHYVDGQSEPSFERQQALLSCAKFVSRQSNQDLAYVIFTSGSTGVPKGVAIEHRSAVNTLLDINNRYQVGAKDAVLCVSLLSFDLSVYDFFGLLAVGGRIVIPAQQDLKAPHKWRQLIEQHNISIWDTVPACAELLVNQCEIEKISEQSSPRLFMLSGDWINPALPRRLLEVFKQAELHSLGGATEGSIWSISYPIDSATNQQASIPYGRPLSNQKILILNEAAELVPTGVYGEIHIGGVGVAREYFNAPEITQKSFFEHPKYGRLYRTGDSGKYRDDGVVIFAGRMDHQVKLRGYRVELGEVESVLMKHNDITKVVVKTCANHQNLSLVAYVTCRAELAVSPSQEELKQEVAKALPNYMVPNHIILLDEFPLSSNGKVDIARLPDPEVNQVQHDEALSETESKVANMWAQLLEVDNSQIGKDSNFFELGGQSMLVIQLLSLIRHEFAVEIEPFQLFEVQSLAELATLVEQHVIESSVTQNRHAQVQKDEMEVVL